MTEKFIAKIKASLSCQYAAPIIIKSQIYNKVFGSFISILSKAQVISLIAIRENTVNPMLNDKCPKYVMANITSRIMAPPYVLFNKFI